MRSSIRPRNKGQPSFFRPTHGFTVLELVVTMAIMLVIMVAMLEFVGSVEQTWKANASDPFADAETAFETMAQNLAAATLNPYVDYADSNGAFRTSASTNFVPDHPARRSDLDFVCGSGGGPTGLLTINGRTTTGCAVFFVAPQGYTQTYAHQGMERLLNALGYFVEFGNDDATPAFIGTATPVWRWRLKQVMQPAESLQVYALASSSDWIQQLVQPGASVSILADNVITLIVLPERAANDTAAPLSPDFVYDSRYVTNTLTYHQLPPRVRLVLVAIDETSARRLVVQNGSNPPALIPPGLFLQASQLDADLVSLDATLSTQKIGHRIFQRDVLLTSSAWSNTSP